MRQLFNAKDIMKNKIKAISAKAVTLLVLFVGTPAYALGPIDGEVGLGFWSNHYESDLQNGELDLGTTFAHGELWLFDEWGVRGSYFDSDLEESAFSNQQRTVIEARKRFLSLSDNNFFALGAGLENIALTNGQDTSGLRLSAEARLGLPLSIFLYGRAGWSPVLESTSGFDDISSREIEVGAHFTPMPFVSLRVGYLQYDLDYSLDAAQSNESSSGFFVGAGFHW